MKNLKILFSMVVIMACSVSHADDFEAQQYLPLHAIIKNQDYSLQQKLNMIKTALQDKEVDINAVDANGKTALNLLTVLKGDSAIADLLIRFGAKVDEPDLFNNTPLLNAISTDQVATAAILLQNHADPLFKNDMEKNAYDVAQSDASQQVLDNQ